MYFALWQGSLPSPLSQMGLKRPHEQVAECPLRQQDRNPLKDQAAAAVTENSLGSLRLRSDSQGPELSSFP